MMRLAFLLLLLASPAFATNTPTRSPSTTPTETPTRTPTLTPTITGTPTVPNSTPVIVNTPWAVNPEDTDGVVFYVRCVSRSGSRACINMPLTIADPVNLHAGDLWCRASGSCCFYNGTAKRCWVTTPE